MVSAAPIVDAGGARVGVVAVALVRSLVLLHGGHVNAESAGVGQGTRFTVCLPRLGIDRLPAAAVDRADLRAGQRRLRILLVDDNEDGLMMLEMLLASMGHEVVSTAQPREVMARARALQPDVCLLDIGLPDIDGLTLAGMLRADPVTRTAVLMAMSGYGQEADRNAALAAGFERYFVKPVDVQDLAEAFSAIGRRGRDAV